MKKLVLSAILVLGITLSGFSQEKPQRTQKSPEERAQRMTDALDKKLSLTENQKQQVYQLNLERAQAMQHSKGTGKHQDMSQRKAQFEANESRLLSILNTDQRSAYEQLKAERAEKFKSRKGSGKKAHRK